MKILLLAIPRSLSTVLMRQLAAQLQCGFVLEPFTQPFYAEQVRRGLPVTPGIEWRRDWPETEAAAAAKLVPDGGDSVVVKELSYQLAPFLTPALAARMAADFDAIVSLTRPPADVLASFESMYSRLEWPVEELSQTELGFEAHAAVLAALEAAGARVVSLRAEDVLRAPAAAVGRCLQSLGVGGSQLARLPALSPAEMEQTPGFAVWRRWYQTAFKTRQISASARGGAGKELKTVMRRLLPRAREHFQAIRAIENRGRVWRVRAAVAVWAVSAMGWVSVAC